MLFRLGGLGIAGKWLTCSIESDPIDLPLIFGEYPFHREDPAGVRDRARVAGDLGAAYAEGDEGVSGDGVNGG